MVKSNSQKDEGIPTHSLNNRTVTKVDNDYVTMKINANTNDYEIISEDYETMTNDSVASQSNNDHVHINGPRDTVADDVRESVVIVENELYTNNNVASKNNSANAQIDSSRDTVVDDVRDSVVIVENELYTQTREADSQNVSESREGDYETTIIENDLYIPTGAANPADVTGDE